MKQETVLLRQWATNLVTQKVNEDSRMLRNWTLKEIKETRDMFKVPGHIGQPLDTPVVSSDGEGEDGQIGSPVNVAPVYQNFQEYVCALASN